MLLGISPPPPWSKLVIMSGPSTCGYLSSYQKSSLCPLETPWQQTEIFRETQKLWIRITALLVKRPVPSENYLSIIT